MMSCLFEVLLRFYVLSARSVTKTFVLSNCRVNLFKILLILSVRSGILSKLHSIMSGCCVIMLQINNSRGLVPIQCHHNETVCYPVYLSCYHVDHYVILSICHVIVSKRYTFLSIWHVIVLKCYVILSNCRVIMSNHYAILSICHDIVSKHCVILYICHDIMS